MCEDGRSLRWSGLGDTGWLLDLPLWRAGLEGLREEGAPTPLLSFLGSGLVGSHRWCERAPV